MVKNLIHDPMFLAGRSDKATGEDLPIAKNLLETLISHRDTCVGMAANMIGERKRIIAFFDESGVLPRYTVMLNPEVVAKSGEYLTEESCLSLFGGPRPCKRYEKITVRFQTERFETKTQIFTGWTAQIIQHEIDHTNGVLI